MKRLRRAARSGVGPEWSEGSHLFAIALGGPGVHRKDVAKKLRVKESMLSMLAHGHRMPLLLLAARIERLFPIVDIRSWTRRLTSDGSSLVVKTDDVHDVSPAPIVPHKRPNDPL